MYWVLAKRVNNTTRALGLREVKPCAKVTHLSQQWTRALSLQSLYSLLPAVMIWLCQLSLYSYPWSSHLWRTHDKLEPNRELPEAYDISSAFLVGGGVPGSWFSDAKIPHSNPILLVSREGTTHLSLKFLFWQLIYTTLKQAKMILSLTFLPLHVNAQQMILDKVSSGCWCGPWQGPRQKP